MKYSFLVVTLLLCCLFCSCSETDEQMSVVLVEADSAYAREDYEEAQQKYQLVADSVQDASIFYNLGCCYYRAVFRRACRCHLSCHF